MDFVNESTITGFTNHKHDKEERLEKAIDTIKERHGTSKITRAILIDKKE